MSPEYVRSNLRLLFREFNLKRLRNGKPELTQEEFGELAGLSRATVNRWMSDKPLEYRKLNYERNKAVEAFVRVLNITVGELLTPVDRNGNVIDSPEYMPGAARQIA